MIGSALGSAIAVGLGAVNRAPISGFYGWFAVEKWWVYIFAILVGTLTVTALTLLLRKNVSISTANVVEESNNSNADYFSEDQWEN